ncbi:DNA polymerase I B, chloroplastic/mitochondrial isoform X2 [Tripterygium wilfordii]|nr:DNA polymerase I B, chloroplastic/mitochondrial isoform X2 [Tripterygium wilfordii]
MYNSSIGFQHYSGKTSIDKKTCNWKLEIGPCASKASMLQLYLDQNCSGRKHFTRTIINQERMGVKSGKLPRNSRRAPAVEFIKNYPCGRKVFSTATHGSEYLHGSAVSWTKERENLAKQKKEQTFVGEMKFQHDGNQHAYPSKVKCTLKTEPFYQSQLTEKQACSEIVGRQHSAIKNYAAPVQIQPSQGAEYLENIGWHVNTKNYDASALSGTESKGTATGRRPLYNVNDQCADGPCKTDMPFINGQGEGARARGSFRAESIVKGEKFEQIGDEVADLKKCQLDGEQTTNVTDNHIKSSDKDEASVIQADLQKRLTSIYRDILVVDNISKAKEVVGMLTSRYRHLVHACDTEVAKIDVKQETPVDHGEVTCFSIYSGPEADFGNGKSCVWVDVLDGGGRALFLEFAPFFEDPSIKKVWHNYSFDNHVIENYGLKLSGFHADTMHMARLWDSSRRTEGGYSLEALTGDKRVMSSAGDKKTSRFAAGNQRTVSEANSQNIMPEAGSFHEDLLGKISMKTIFGRRKIKKDGSEGKMITIASVEELQREERELWICYSALDAKSTLKLYESLKAKLLNMCWKLDGEPVRGKNMFDFYLEYWQPFGGLLVEMETAGMLVDRAYLAHIEKVAKTEQEVAVSRFREWASRYCPDAKYMNVGSDAQLRQLLFGGRKNSITDDVLPVVKEFKVPNVDKVVEEGKKAPKKYQTIKLRRIVSELPTDIYTPSGWPSVSGVALKTLAGKLTAEGDFMDDNLLLEDEIIETLEGEESCGSTDVNENDDGTVFKAFECENETREACLAIASLCEICSIDSLISNFILPLQGSNVSGESGRVHCSLNINTETGRLSARRPNLQNQPALEKDRYKIRQAFIAAPGNSLIVADYGQLELRILAHLANCKSMLLAFEAGGDFHSRTAMNMYSNIREAVEKREVLLEWYPQPGEDRPPVPLLKDAFASERRKAKMLNFSIAYGKTPVGLSRDWKVSVNEAKKTVALWYGERQEVLEWQEARKKEALEDRRVHTLLGRARNFPSVSRGNRSLRGHIERAAINAPVQGSAADVAMCAMLEISKNIRLKELGWRLLLQVHDEVILEGPTETAEVAKEIVVECMSKPFNGKNILRVGLSVDAKCAQNWYAAK